jgi:hypothetical protein
MRISTLLIALFPVVAQAEGMMTLQPDLNGNVRIIAQGGTGSRGGDVLGFQQQANQSLTLNFNASGMSHCEYGDLIIEGLRISVTNMLDNNKVKCGWPQTVEEEGKNREIPLKVSTVLAANKMPPGLSLNTPALLPIGSVIGVHSGGRSQQYPLYIDLSILQQNMEILTASFSRPELHLGEVGDIHDASGSIQLRVSKSAQAGSDAITYSLSFESSQQMNNQYRMRATAQDHMVPYQILIGGRNILPGDIWRGMVPVGAGSSDVVDIQFRLAGKQTRGLAAGISLQDTVTAVITPDS